MKLRITSPARYDDCLTLAPSTRFGWKGAIWMRARCETAAIHAGDTLLAIGFLLPLEDGEIEFCLAIAPEARGHMRALIRIAHLTFKRITDTGKKLRAHVHPGHLPGERMARLVGFVPDETRPGKWIQNNGRSE